MEIVKSLVVLLALAVILSVVGLVLYGGVDGVWKGEGQINIDASNEMVYEFLTEPERRKEWVDGLVRAEVESVRRLEQGGRIKETLDHGGLRSERVLECVELQYGKAVGFRTTTQDGVGLEIHYKLSANQTGRRTKLNYTFEAHYRGWWNELIEPILGQMAQKEQREELGALKVRLAAGI